jgi:hypothetical protein
MSPREFEKQLDSSAILFVLSFLLLTMAWVFSWADTGWPIGLFTGFLLRHCLH